MEQKFCQSCGTLLTDNNKGTNADGDFIVSGAQTPRIGGVIMMKSDSRETIMSILAQDPFHINDIADYQVVEFTPTMFRNEDLKSFLT